jgi:hypothetical protein
VSRSARDEPVARPEKRVRLDILGPRDHLDAHRFPRVRFLLQRVRSPWDTALLLGIATALWGIALSGVILIVDLNGSLISLAVGLPLVGIASALASHLVYRAQRA